MLNRPLLPAFVCFAGGILAGRFITFHDHFLFYLVLLLALLTLFLLFISDKIKILAFPAIFLLSGMFFITCKGDPVDLLKIVENRKVVLEGTVLSPPKINNEIKRFELKTEKLFIEKKVFSINQKILVTVYNDSEIFPIGMRIRFPAYLKPFINFNNPGAYDYELSMRLRDISNSASVSDGRYIVQMGKGDPGFIMGVTEYVRSQVREFLNTKLPSKDSAIYKALLLGEKEGINRTIREPFNKTGMGHILAVSGLHIGIIAWLSFLIFNWILSQSSILTIKYNIKKISAIVTCIPVIAYTGLSGFQVSGQRAMIMALAYLVSIVLERERDIWSTLILSSFIILAIDPMAIQSISFQLTFLAATGILWLTPVFQRIWKDPSVIFPNNVNLKKIYVYITGLISASLAAAIFLLPVTIYYFHRVPTVTIFANLLILPLLGFIVLPAGFLALLVLAFSSGLAEIILFIGTSGLHLIMYIIEYLADLPWAFFWMVTPSITEIILFYCLLFCAVFIKKWTWIKLGMVITILIAVVDISFWVYDTRFDRDLRITFIDVGQGNSALIQFPGKKRMLIDGGGFRVGTFDTGENVVAPFLFNRKILTIDYLVLSHPHPDHMNGLSFIASELNSSEFWYNGEVSNSDKFIELMDTVKSKGMKLLTPDDLVSGVTISGVKIEILHPAHPRDIAIPVMNKNRLVNNYSLVLKMTYKGKSILFTGDIEEDTEKKLVKKYGKKLKSDVLLVPHHGSKYSSTQSFLKMVAPKFCIISSRKGNLFGFPHPETIDRLTDIGSSIFRIDQKGAVRVVIGEKDFYSKYCIDK